MRAKRTTTSKPPRSQRPIMVLLDLLGRRWSLRILWELRSSSYNFRALRAACGDISPSMLNTRLRELRAASLVALDEGGYSLTERGHSLSKCFMPLYYWAEDWSASLSRSTDVTAREKKSPRKP